MTRLLALFCLTAATLAHAAPDEIPIGSFSKARAGGELPAGWRPLDFSRVDRPTEYALVEDGGVVVVRAESKGSASGLIRSVDVDLATHPILEWRWRIQNVMEKGDVTRKEGDDYPARIYVAFAYDPDKVGLFERIEYGALRLVYGEYPPQAALNYIWASHNPVGLVVSNPYSDRARMIVVESGDSLAGVWRTASRDVAADYRAAFGGEPPRVAGVAIMTDTDDTGESALSWFGDIVFRPLSGEFLSPEAGEASETSESIQE